MNNTCRLALSYCTLLTPPEAEGNSKNAWFWSLYSNLCILDTLLPLFPRRKSDSEGLSLETKKGECLCQSRLVDGSHCAGRRMSSRESGTGTRGVLQCKLSDHQRSLSFTGMASASLCLFKGKPRKLAEQLRHASKSEKERRIRTRQMVIAILL